MKFWILTPFFFLILSCSTEDESNKPLLNYVPKKALFVVKIQDHQAFINTLQNNTFLGEFKNSENYKSILNKINYLDFLSPKSESIVSLTETEVNNYEFLYVTENTGGLVNLDTIKNKPIKTASGIVEYLIDDVPFYSLIANQKIIISSSKLLLENLDLNDSNHQPETLKRLFAITNKNKSASIFINIKNSNSALASSTKENSDIQISGFSDWVSLDLKDNETNLSLSGVSVTNDSTQNKVDLLANLKPIANKTALFAPSNADAFLSYSLDSYDLFAKNRELSSGIVSPIDPPMDSVEELGIAYMSSGKVVILNTYGSEDISKYLLSQKKAAITYQGQEILQLSKNDFLNNRFSPVIADFDANFCVFIKNAFVFSETQNTLKEVISSFKNVSTFNKTAVFNTLNKELSQESNVLFISNWKNIEVIFNREFNTDFSADLKNVKLSKYGFAFQTIADKGFYHTNLVIQQIGDQTKTTSSSKSELFQIDFDAKLATNPQFIINAKTGQTEIVVQDQNNLLYLLSNKGKVIWKKQLNSLVQGKIEPVDINKNGRLQLAFTTNNQFLILDRKGEEVKRFTKTYEGGNLNPLAVFDYDGNKNYRFVVTQREKTFMYDSKAKIVDGFKYTKAEQSIIAPPKHIVVNNKDFIVYKLKGGILKLLSRVGDVRVKVSEKIDFSDNEVFNYKNKFAVTDKKGVLHQIDLKGKISKTNFNLSNDHGMSATEGSLVLMNDNILTIKGKKVELELGVYTTPQIFYLRKKLYISVTDLQNEKIYLFDSQAKSIKNFPIDGSSVVDLKNIGKNKTLQLLVKENDNSLILYKL